MDERRCRRKTRRRARARCPASSLPFRDGSAPPADIAGRIHRPCADTRPPAATAAAHRRAARAGTHCGPRQCAAATAAIGRRAQRPRSRPRPPRHSRAQLTSPVKTITATMSSSRYAAMWFTGRPMAATAKARAAALRHPAPAALAAAAGGAPSRGDIIKVPMQRPEPAQIGPCVACRFGSNPRRALKIGYFPGFVR